MSQDPVAIQISVFLENKAGQLASLIHLLAVHKINIRALSLADTSDFGILRLMVSRPEEAATLLKEHGFTTGRANVVAVELKDEPGSLDKILQLLSKNSINVEYMYACARRDERFAIMIFRFDKTDEAISILRRHDYPIVSGQSLNQI